MENSKIKQSTLAAFIISGITFCYILQMSPAPVLLKIGEYFNIMDNNVLLNMPVNIMYPFIIIGCITGNGLERKIGTYKMFVITLLLVGIGSLLNLISGSSYAVMLTGRSIYGLGFGFGVPFIGTAIMKWFEPHNREKMNTFNGFFPFIGTVIAFSIIAPIAEALGWQWSLAVWGVGALAVLLVWILTIKEKNLPDYTASEEEGEEIVENNLYRGLLKRKEIKILIVAFFCDFTCYSFLAVILPTFLFEASSLNENMAGLLAAFAFPAVGLVGALTSGVIMSKTGKRKPQLVVGQVLSFIGFLTLTLGAPTSVVFILIGVALYAFGNGFWLPPLYCVPMELEEMTPSRVGGAFALITAIGFVFGFLSPVIGGVLTDKLMAVSNLSDPVASHVFGLRWTMFIFCFVYIINFIIMLRLRETGPAIQKN